jgi:8-oxo-dGTP pyrophosphatase MutT (NUDIX family)
MSDNFIQNLTQRLQQPLPGRAAQLRMAHTTRRLYVDAPADARQAGVLAALFQKNEVWQVVLIERKQVDGDRHGGQIGFPGGKYEPEDASLQDTALREAEEEVGISRQDVRVLGKLTELYIPVSNFQVHPFVGYLANEPSFTLQEEEVRAVLTVPFAHFQKENAVKKTSIRIGKHLVLKDVPYFYLEGKVLWGATAMMLNELMQLMR